MGLPQELDDWIKESIDYTLGLPVSTSTLEVKLRASEEAQNVLRNNCLALHSMLKEKDLVIERVRKEACLNATALKKFIEENQKLHQQCEHWSTECGLFENDRDKLMEFGNEADERAREAEARVEELEKEVIRLSDEVQFYKHQYEAILADNSVLGETPEDSLLESALALIPLISGDDDVSARAFLEENSNHESCQKLLEMWMCLKPSTRKALSLVAELKSLENDKDHLRSNLLKAEEEVNISLRDETSEDSLLESVLASLPPISGDIAVSARAFLEENSDHQSCQKLLEMWISLKPTTRKALSLVAELKSLENDKDHLRINLCKAEEEVNVLFEENNLLDKACKKLLKRQREQNSHDSSGKHANTASAKSNKRRSSSKSPIEKQSDFSDVENMSNKRGKSGSKAGSPIQKKMDFGDVENMVRKPLSPVRLNMSDSRVH